MEDGINLTAEHVRSGRALLQWSQGDLAKHAEVAISTIADFEKGLRMPIANNLAAMRDSMESAGVRFTPDDALVSVALFLMSEHNAADLILQYGTKGMPAVQDVLSAFGDVHADGVSIEAVQAATPELKKSLDDLVTKHGRLRQSTDSENSFSRCRTTSIFWCCQGDLRRPPKSSHANSCCTGGIIRTR